MLPALVSRTPIVFLCGSREKKRERETPEIAPLHTDPVTLLAALSDTHTCRERRTHIHTAFPLFSEIFRAYDSGYAACRHTRTLER